MIVAGGLWLSEVPSVAGGAWLSTAQWMCAVPNGWAGCLHCFNKICSESRAESSRLGVGESSELMGVVYC